MIRGAIQAGAVRWAGLTVFLSALTALVTYPQILRLDTGVNDFGDPLLNAWALSWPAHALVTPDAGLLDANIFHPEPRTLALSETLLFPALLVAPLRWLGAGPISLHNVTLLSGFVLSGLTMFLLVEFLTGDWRGAVVSAAAFTILPLRLEHYPRVQLQMTYLMPLGLYLVHRLMRPAESWRSAVLLGISLAALFASCVYYAIYFATVLPVLLIVLWLLTRTAPAIVFSRFAVASLVALVITAPLAPAYLHNRRLVGERQVIDLVRGSAEVADYTRATSHSSRYGPPFGSGPAERHLFPGGTLLGLAAAGAALAPATALPYLAVAAVAFDASLGVNGHLYRPLHDYVFAYGALRVPARFAMLTVMFLSVLAGLGASMLLKRLARAPAQYAILGLILAALIAESLPRPLVLSELPTRIPPVYHWLKNMPAGPILEYPVGQLGGRVGPQDPTYMFYSTVHWRPLLNGYSGFAPLSYYELLAEMQNFPDPASLEYLRRRGARYLLVHQRFYMRPGFEADVAALDTAAAVRRVAEFRDGDRWATVVYEIRPSAGGRR